MSRALEEVEVIDLDDYLRATSQFEVPAEERLRLLAVELEFQVYCESKLRSWAALDRIYQLALRLAPSAAWTHASRGISAAELANMTDDADEAARLFAKAYEALLRASDLAPDDADIAYGLGHAIYMDRTRGVEEALQHFDRGLKLDPHHGWAALYRAHCLQDLERWTEAAVAYTEVPMDQFTGPPSWRMDLLVEQRGWCRLMAGDKAGALADFERILSRYEKQPHLARWSLLTHLTKAAGSAFPELAPRIEAVEERLGGLRF